jgi:NADPH:quinone reductase-like Zn-dependent oxidoreductase
MRAFRVTPGVKRRAWTRCPVPTPRPDEALVRVEAAVVTHLDHTVAGGEFVMKPALPSSTTEIGRAIDIQDRAGAPGRLG